MPHAGALPRRKRATTISQCNARISRSSAMALGALTDLEFLKANCKKLLNASQCTELSARMPQFKQEITSAVEKWWPKPIVRPKTISATSVVTDAAQVTPGAAAWSAHVADAAAGEQLLAVWYRRDPTWHVWVALPELQKTPTKIDAGGRATAFSAALPATNFQRCLDSGAYRIEFYRQGQRAGRASTMNALDGFVPNFDPRLNLAVCTPPEWKRDAKTSQAGTATQMFSPLHVGGLRLARRDDPEPIDATGADLLAAHELSAIMRADDCGCVERRGSLRNARGMAPHVVYGPRRLRHRTNRRRRRRRNLRRVLRERRVGPRPRAMRHRKFARRVTVKRGAHHGAAFGRRSRATPYGCATTR